MLLNYVENCDLVQNIDTKTGLGEPKVNIDGTAFNEPWGRPQNDGPALRGLNMIAIFKLFKNDYSNICEKIIIPILQRDLNYVFENYNKVSYDLWEEIVGWHFYTRVVQLKFIKEISNNYDILKNSLNIPDDLDKKFVDLQTNLLHHKTSDSIISSFNIKGEIVRMDDASVLLALCHIDFDLSIIKLFECKKIYKGLFKFRIVF